MPVGNLSLSNVCGLLFKGHRAEKIEEEEVEQLPNELLRRCYFTINTLKWRRGNID